MRKITIEAFKNLKPLGSVDRDSVYGFFAMSEKVHSRQCEDISIGDTAFVYNIQPNVDDPDVKETLSVEQLVIVEQQ